MCSWCCCVWHWFYSIVPHFYYKPQIKYFKNEFALLRIEISIILKYFKSWLIRGFEPRTPAWKWKDIPMELRRHHKSRLVATHKRPVMSCKGTTVLFLKRAVSGLKWLVLRQLYKTWKIVTPKTLVWPVLTRKPTCEPTTTACSKRAVRTRFQPVLSRNFC